jgi:hypothetical protein
VTRGNTSIAVAFVAPGNGGSAITGYTAGCTSSDGGGAGSNTGSASPIVVSSLTNGKTYTCTVFATNLAGNGTASAASGSVVPAAVPSAPAAAILTRGNAQISVAFVTPADNGTAIIGYTASCTSSDGGVSGSNTGLGSPIVVFALTNGKSYTCAVIATNAVGDGLPSSTSATAVPATLPSAPARPTLTRGNQRLSVAFLAPANGGSAITSYTAICTSSDGGVAGGNSGASSPIVVMTPLTNGKVYTCKVRATNAEGAGSLSVASAAMRPGVRPENIVRPTITGMPINHRTLTAHDGTWRAGPPPVITRQWQRCNLRVMACVNIAGAVGRTYVLRNADLNHRIRVVVKGTNVLGSLSAAAAATRKIRNG